MKILIISSEHLNPENILGSIFELTQASILSQIAEVCILSVSPNDSVIARLKSKFKKKNTAVADAEHSADNIIGTVLLGTNMTNTYIIEGIPVFEGKNYSWYSRGGYNRNLKRWIKAGNAAYHQYRASYGKPDIIHSHGRFMNAGLLALQIHKSTGIPFIYTEHSTAYKSGTAPAEAKPILLEITEKAAAVIAVSKPLLIDLELFLGKSLQNAKVVPNTMDPVFELPLNKNITTGPFRFICIASFHPKKGLDILLHAFKLAFQGDRNYTLTLCGDGPLKDELHVLTDQLNLSQCIHFPGNLTKEEIKNNLDLSNVLVVSSLYETFGVVILEAMARGCPVVSTRCGGPEFILNEESGMLVKPGEKNEMAEALKKMVLEYNKFDRAKIRDRVIAEYGSKTFLLNSKKLYHSVLGTDIR